MLLQKALSGKAQIAVVALNEECADYETVKMSILKNFELVPEVYKLKFRNYKIKERQTYVEFVKMKECRFDRLCLARKTDGSYEELKQLMLVEEFQNNVPEEIRIYSTEEYAITYKEWKQKPSPLVYVGQLVYFCWQCWVYAYTFYFSKSEALMNILKSLTSLFQICCLFVWVL